MDFSADITLRKTRMKFWIERSRLFCYSVIKVLRFVWKRFIILSHRLVLVKNFFKKLLSFFRSPLLISRCELLYIITWLIICQEKIPFSLKIFNTFLSKMCFSCATDIMLSQTNYHVKHFFNNFHRQGTFPKKESLFAAWEQVLDVSS